MVYDIQSGLSTHNYFEIRYASNNKMFYIICSSNTVKFEYFDAPAYYLYMILLSVEISKYAYDCCQSWMYKFYCAIVIILP